MLSMLEGMSVAYIFKSYHGKVIICFLKHVRVACKYRLLWVDIDTVTFVNNEFLSGDIIGIFPANVIIRSGLIFTSKEPEKMIVLIFANLI